MPEWEEIAAVSCAVQNMWLTATACGAAGTLVTIQCRLQVMPMLSVTRLQFQTPGTRSAFKPSAAILHSCRLDPVRQFACGTNPLIVFPPAVTVEDLSRFCMGSHGCTHAHAIQREEGGGRRDSAREGGETHVYTCKHARMVEGQE